MHRIMDLTDRQAIYNALTTAAYRERKGPFGSESATAKQYEIIASRLGRGVYIIVETVPDFPGVCGG